MDKLPYFLKLERVQIDQTKMTSLFIRYSKINICDVTEENDFKASSTLSKNLSVIIKHKYGSKNYFSPTWIFACESQDGGRNYLLMITANGMAKLWTNNVGTRNISPNLGQTRNKFEKSILK